MLTLGYVLYVSAYTQSDGSWTLRLIWKTCNASRKWSSKRSIASDGNFSPIAVTDINEKLVAPNTYEEKLAGATVLLHFIVSCDVFLSQKMQFYTDVQSITVLQEPCETNQILGRRKFDVPAIATHSRAREE